MLAGVYILIFGFDYMYREIEKRYLEMKT